MATLIRLVTLQKNPRRAVSKNCRSGKVRAFMLTPCAPPALLECFQHSSRVSIVRANATERRREACRANVSDIFGRCKTPSMRWNTLFYSILSAPNSQEKLIANLPSYHTHGLADGSRRSAAAQLVAASLDASLECARIEEVRANPQRLIFQRVTAEHPTRLHALCDQA